VRKRTLQPGTKALLFGPRVDFDVESHQNLQVGRVNVRAALQVDLWLFLFLQPSQKGLGFFHGGHV